MARIHMIRHGKAAAGWDGHPDPGLDGVGRAQADAVAGRLAKLAPAALLSSPMARARETADATAAVLDLPVSIEARVAEIPSPMQDLQARGEWLRNAMAGSWADLEDTYRSWRDDVVAALAELTEDTLVFSHFIAINAAAGHCLGRDDMIVFRPTYCSVTAFDVVDGKLSLVELGAEAETEIR